MMPDPEVNAASSAAHSMQQFQEQLSYLSERVSRIEASVGLTGAVSPTPADSAYRPNAGSPAPPARPRGISVQSAPPSPRLPAEAPRRSEPESPGSPAPGQRSRSSCSI